MNVPYPTPSSAASTAVMKGNRRRDTRAELGLRSALHSRGLRFRRDFPIGLKELTVKPDIVFTRHRVAVFMDGCFWHACPQHGNVPRVNKNYWVQKFQRNRDRVVRVDEALTSAGWRIVRIWEHEDVAAAAIRVITRLDSPRSNVRSQGALVSRQVSGSKSEYLL